MDGDEKLKAGKSRKTCLTNHTWPIYHIMPLVINVLGVDKQIDRQTDTHIPMSEPKQFQETRQVRPLVVHTWFKKLVNIPSMETQREVKPA